ncbi:hypothetical protein K3U93_17635 [Mycobacterium malmoense]|uniref:hypothetical protein n=1 Tax=Mycobacterium malmoense TaxID=1780 RepID=UPI00111C78F7|nr:hypothetical protein [Mycobacterium malmoense]QZA16480.1 hypothetical protein K3U93_17635 [Mycobacterium malmoense]UNB93282.1 hypothetical protein H5T25_17620 [Mycobacterium malmoense]
MSFEQDTYHRINQMRAQLGQTVVMPNDFPPMGELPAKLPNLKRNWIAKGLSTEMLRWRMGYWKETGLLTDTSFFPEYDETSIEHMGCMFAVCYGNPARIPLRDPNDWKQVAQRVFLDNETGCGVHETPDCDSGIGSELFAYVRGDYICVFKCCPACLAVINDPNPDPASHVGLLHEDSVPIDVDPWA